MKYSSLSTYSRIPLYKYYALFQGIWDLIHPVTVALKFQFEKCGYLLCLLIMIEASIRYFDLFTHFTG